MNERTSNAAKVCNTLLDRIRPTIQKILRNNQNCFRRNRSVTSQILTICRLIEGVSSRHSISYTEQIQLANGLPKETITAILMLVKTRWHSCRNLARRNISTIFIYTLPKLRSSNIHRPNKKWFPIEKSHKLIISSKNITEAVYSVDPALLQFVSKFYGRFYFIYR